MENNLEPRKIEIGQETLKCLNTTRKWTMFLAILGFIFLGLIIVIGLIAGTFLSAFNNSDTTQGVPESILFASLFLLAVIYFFPVLFLFRFSKHTSAAVMTLDEKKLQKAFKNLRLYFVYLGVLVIIVLSFYIIALIVSGASPAFLKSLG